MEDKNLSNEESCSHLASDDLLDAAHIIERDLPNWVLAGATLAPKFLVKAEASTPPLEVLKKKYGIEDLSSWRG